MLFLFSPSFSETVFLFVCLFLNSVYIFEDLVKLFGPCFFERWKPFD